MSLLTRLVMVVVSCIFLHLGQAMGAPIKLTVGYLSLGPTSGPAWIAKEAGFFDKNGLDVELIYVPPAVLTQAMLARSIPLGLMGATTLIEANLRGADFVLLGSIMHTSSVSFLVTRKEITKVEQLKGKRMGISRYGAASHRILEMALQKLGLDPQKDVSFLQIGSSPLRTAALKAGNIDGTILAVEESYAASKLGLNVLFDIRKVGIEYLTNDMATTRRFVKENEDIVRRFVKSNVEGIHFFKTHKEKTIEILIKYMRTKDREVIEASYDWHAQAFPRKPYVSMPGWNAVIQHISTMLPKAAEVKSEQMIDERFVAELDKSGFIDILYK